ncbi:PAS domain S-box protein [Kordiimonas aestuarii]|uniref:PAS domain S-box protein n=1 Tax=Kordiimonas aestuarii TaxID=1005925 RepID=UPI0021D00EA6|nr:PAS domain S-box protein [Kordiimonas aestuarii]
MSLIENLFSNDFMPHGYCYMWAPEVLWTHVLSDALIAISYFSIPLSLVAFIKKRNDIKFSNVFYLFSAFIFLCGVTHIFNIITVWHGTYGLSGIAKLATAIVSFFTAVAVWRLIPVAVAIPSQRQLERIVEERTRELEQKSSRLELVLGKISPAVIGVDGFGRIKLANSAATELFGYSSEELLEKPVEILVPEASRERHPSHRAMFYADMKSRPMGQGRELYGQRKDGQLFPVEIGLTTVDDDPDLVVIATVVDVSERMRVASEHRRMIATIEAVDDAIFSLDMMGTIQNWTPGAESMFGHGVEKAVGWPASLILGEEEGKNGLSDVLEKVESGRSVRNFETRYAHADGHEIDVSMAFSPIKNTRGIVTGAAVVAQDITAAKKLTQEQQQLNEKLARSNEALDQFVYIAAHDLKEPLRGIHNLASILMEDCLDVLDEEYQEDLKNVASLTVRMESLIEDLREYSRIERRLEKAEMSTPRQAIDNVQADLKTFLGERGGKVVVSDNLPSVRLSSACLTTIFSNLITNGIKYNESADKIVEITGETHADFVEFRVKDNGIGIEPEYKERVFDMFRRLHGAGDYGGGTGAGLAIVKRVIEHHDGSIVFESVKGGGTVFLITLPTPRED